MSSFRLHGLLRALMANGVVARLDEQERWRVWLPKPEPAGGPADALGNPAAIGCAEDLLRRTRTGELVGVIAVATGPDDLAHVTRGGHVNLTQTAVLLEHERLRCVDVFMGRFVDADDHGSLHVVLSDHEHLEDA